MKNYLLMVKSILKSIDLKKWAQHLLAIMVMLLVVVVYFLPQLDGKVIQQGDMISAKGARGESELYQEQTGKETPYQWTNGQFGGMPRTYHLPSKKSIFPRLYKLFRLSFAEPIGIFLVMMLSSYIMLIMMGVSPWVSVGISIGVTLSTLNLMLWGAGHNSKVRTIAFIPLVIAGVLYVFEYKKYISGGALLLLGLGFNLFYRHPQMTYYTLLVFLVYGIIKLTQTIKTGQWRHFLIASGIVIAAGAVAFGASSTRLLAMLEYNKSSMRGKPVLVQEDKKNTEATSSSEVEGLDWEYAMSWSNGTPDIISTFIPGFAGGGSGEKIDSKYLFKQLYGVDQAPLYWGSLPFTEGPIYFGAVLIFLFVFSLFYIKGSLKWWLGTGVLLTVLLSYGKNFALLNKVVFEYLPLYSKFRAPQSVLTIAIFFVGLLAALGLNKAFTEPLYKAPRKKRGKQKSTDKSRRLQLKADFKRSLLWATGICGGFALLMAIAGPSLFSLEGASDAQYIQQGVTADVFFSDRKRLLQVDAIRTLFLVLLSAGVLLAYRLKKISQLLGVLLFIGLIAFDVWGVGNRYLSHDDFVTPRVLQGNFEPRPVDQQIMQIERARHAYRVFDVTVNTFNSSYVSNFHNHVGGYDPVKLQRFQDIIEQHIQQNTSQVFNMLNTKYFIIQGQDGQPSFQVNQNALGNGWLVGTLQKVSTPAAEISALDAIDPASTAVILDEEFNQYVGDFQPVFDSTASIILREYEPDHLTYNFQATSEQFAVFSEIWYQPGWQAYLDGEPVEHVRVNYILRGMRIPAGQHQIEFKFSSPAYQTGERITAISSIIMLLFLLLAVGLQLYKRFRHLREQEAPQVNKA